MHNHTLNATTTVSPTRGGNSPTGNLLATTANAGTNTVDIYAGGAPNTNMNAAAIGIAGGNVPVNIIQPILAINFIIALVGIFPSRN